MKKDRVSALFQESAAAHAGGSPTMVDVDLMDHSDRLLDQGHGDQKDTKNIKAGQVIFEVSNDSKGLVSICTSWGSASLPLGI